MPAAPKPQTRSREHRRSSTTSVTYPLAGYHGVSLNSQFNDVPRDSAPRKAAGALSPFRRRPSIPTPDPYGSNDMPYNLQTSPGAINPYYILRRNIDLNIPPPARIAPIRVAQRADGVKKYTACISFEVEGRKKAPTIAELLHKHVVLVDKDEEVWVTRKVKTESITWIFDWPGLDLRSQTHSREPVLTPAGSRITRADIALEIATSFWVAVREQQRGNPAFNQTLAKGEEMYFLQNVRLDKVRLESLDCFKAVGSTVKKWSPKFSYEV